MDANTEAKVGAEKKSSLMKGLLDNEIKDFAELEKAAPNHVVRNLYAEKSGILREALARAEEDYSNANLIETFKQVIEECRVRAQESPERVLREHYELCVETLQRVLDRFVDCLLMPPAEFRLPEEGE